MIPIVLALLLQSSLIDPDRPTPKWVAEKRGDALVVRRKSEAPVDYGYAKPYSPDLIVSCLPDSKALDVFIHLGVKPSEWGFLARFDTDPALQVTADQAFDDASFKRVWGPSTAYQLQELRVRRPERQAFVAQLVSHRSLRVRFTTGAQREATYDLTGLAEAIGPLEDACGLREALVDSHKAALAAGAAKTGAAGAKTQPMNRKVGSWLVRETTSSFDDHPIVVLANTDRTNALNLVLRCQEGQAEAYVQANFVMASTDKTAKFVPFPYGFDGQPPKDFIGSASQDLTGVFFPDGKAFLRELRGHRTMGVRHQRSGATRSVPATFDLTGLEAALPPFIKNCPLD